MKRLRKIGGWKISYKGTTLVELMMYMGLLVILLSILTTIFVQIIDAQLESQASSAVEQDGRYMLAKLMYDINSADAILSPALGNTGISMQLSKGGKTYTYILNGENLQESSLLGTNVLNSYDASVSALTFQQLGKTGGKNSVQVTFTLTSKVRRQSGFEVRNFQSTGGIR